MTPKRKHDIIKKQPIPEDFELSDDEPTTVKLNEESRLSSISLLPLIVPSATVNYS